MNNSFTLHSSATSYLDGRRDLTRLFVLGGLFAVFNTVGIAQQAGSLSGVSSINWEPSLSARTSRLFGQMEDPITNRRGEFTVISMAPGIYTVRVSAPKFAPYEKTDVQITAVKRTELTVALTIENVRERVEIDSDTDVSTDARFFPTQILITSGKKEQDVSRTDARFFITDDWRIKPNLPLSLGLHSENQTNISDNLNFAPRFTFAWSPDSGLARKTVVRGGFGIFYDRFSENLTLQALRFNGGSSSQLNLVVNANDPDSAANRRIEFQVRFNW